MHSFLRSFITLLFSVLLCSKVTPSFGHLNIVENDTTICPGASLTFHAIGSISTGLNIDDIYSGVIPIGFNFTFYGLSYNKCLISTNGYLTFDTVNAGMFSPWSITTGVPGNFNALNSVMGNYSDIYPPIGGVIDYVTAGNAPNRKFIVSYCSVPMFSCNTNLTTFQTILYETSNVIEVHITTKNVCSGWNNGAAIEGVQDHTGAYATVVPGRNYPGTWLATNSSHQFVATSATNYSVSAIPYAPVATSGNNFAWYVNTMSGTPFSTNQVLTGVTPTVNTTYYLREIHCTDTTFDSVKVIIGGGGNIGNAVGTNPTTCGNNNGKITLSGLPANQVYTVHYSKNGVAQPVFTYTTPTNGTVVISNLPAGSYSNIYLINTNNCPTNTVGPIVLANPPLTVDYSFALKYGCSQDTALFTNLSTTPGPLYYQWQFGDGFADTSTSPSHIYINQGSYNAKLIASNGFCRDSVTKVVDTQHPLHASFTKDHDSACQQQTITFTNTSTATSMFNIDPQYFWDFGDGGTSTQQSPTYTYTRSGIFHVRLIAQNFVPCRDTAPLQTVVIDSIPFVNYLVTDTVLCAGGTITFNGSYLSIGNTGVTWNFGDATFINNVNPVTHAFDAAGVYNVKLTAHYRICPDTSISKDLTIKPYPNINLGQDTFLCPEGNPITLYEHVNGGNPAVHYHWSNGDTTNAILVKNIGTYWAIVTENGCSVSDSITVNKDCYIDIPNSFTPNNDGANDYFLPQQFLSRSVTSYKMTIYNRWGEKMFETTNVGGRGWDGRFNGSMQPEGVYIYIIDVAFKDDKREHYVGNVTLLR